MQKPDMQMTLNINKNENIAGVFKQQKVIYVCQLTDRLLPVTPVVEYWLKIKTTLKASDMPICLASPTTPYGSYITVNKCFHMSWIFLIFFFK